MGNRQAANCDAARVSAPAVPRDPQPLSKSACVRYAFCNVRRPSQPSAGANRIRPVGLRENIAVGGRASNQAKRRKANSNDECSLEHDAPRKKSCDRQCFMGWTGAELVEYILWGQNGNIAPPTVGDVNVDVPGPTELGSGSCGPGSWRKPRGGKDARELHGADLKARKRPANLASGAPKCDLALLRPSDPTDIPVFRAPK